MALYRCWFLDSTRNTFQLQNLACENVAEAIVMARRMGANRGVAHGFELWQDGRSVHKEQNRSRVIAPVCG
jgi:hypothetical protein